MLAGCLRNAWYAAAQGHDVGRALLSRTLLGEPVVLYRTAAGRAVALADVCPHKLAPLSRGELRGDAVECGYHGATFGPDGACVRLPGETAIPPACVRAYPVAERYGIVWFWPGDPAAADPSLLPEIPEYGDPAWGVTQGTTLHFACHWLLLADNLLDPAHTSFVHKRSVGNAAGEEVPLRLVPAGERVAIGRWVENAPPVPVMERFVQLPERVDRWQFYAFQFPGTGWVDFGAVPAGAPRDDATRNRHFRTQTIQIVTPETDTTTHYFWFHLRTFAIDDAEVTDAIRTSWSATFEEDRVLLAEVQKREERFPDLPRVRLGIDAATVRMRALLSKKLAEEARATSARAPRAAPTT